MDWNSFLVFCTNNKDAIIAFAAIAAVIMSAMTSLLSFIGIIFQNRTNLKVQEFEAVRKLYDSNLQELGDAAYVVLAQAKILVKKFEKQTENPPQEFIDTVKKVKQKIGDAKKVLIDSRRKNRYVLLGVEEAFQKIARIGDWIKNFEKQPQLAHKFIKRGTKLRRLADKSIVRMHRYGRIPKRIVVLKIKYHCWKADRMWEKSRIDHKNENEED